MISLTGTNKSLIIKRGSAKTTNELQWMFSYSDSKNDKFNKEIVSSITGGETSGVTNGTHEVVIAQGIEAENETILLSRRAEFFGVFNADTVNATVYILFKNLDISTVIRKIILLPNTSLLYDRNRGFYVETETGSVVVNQDHFLDATGADAYSGSCPTVTSLYDGLRLSVRFLEANSGPSTLDASGTGAKPMKVFGNDPLNGPGTGAMNPDIKANQILDLRYDVLNDWYQILSVTCNIPNAV